MSVQNSCLRGRQLSTSQIFDTVGCKSFPDFAGTGGEIPVNSYNRPYEFLSVTVAVRSVIRPVEAGETTTT